MGLIACLSQLVIRADAFKFYGVVKSGNIGPQKLGKEE